MGALGGETARRARWTPSIWQREDEAMAGHIPFRKADAWLRATRSIWLASAGVDGTPHAAPVWFAWDGRSIYFCTEPTTVKHANLSDEPSVTAHLGDGDDVLIARGRVAVV